MYAAEQLFNSLTYGEIYYTLRTIAYDDCYLAEFFEDNLLEDFLYLLDMYDIVYIASDDRILLTQKGNKLFQYLGQSVEMDKY